MNNASNVEASPSMSRKEANDIVSMFQRHINRGQVQYLKAGHLDVLESERKGICFVDPISGRKMIDCFSSAGSFNVARHNSEIMKALDEALAAGDMGSFNMISPHKIALAKKLVALAPGDLDRLMYAAGGGDAVDCSIKLARGATSRSQIISTVKGYHGHTGFALSANGKEHYRHYCEPLMPDFTFVPFNDFDAAREAASRDTAAIIVEPVQGEAGIFVGDDEYLRGLRRLCDETGALLIFDEIQTGFGRTGMLWASEHSGVVPDIMTLAKSMGGSLFPNAAVLYRSIPRLTEFVSEHPSFHPTYSGGSDLGCRVSLKVLEYLEEHHLSENAEQMGKRMKDALLDLMAQNPKIIREVRGVGLMVGIEYIHEYMGPMMSDGLAKRGVFAVYSANAPQVMRFMAPITINDEEMDYLIEAISGAMKDMKVLLPLTVAAARIPPLRKLLNSERFQTGLFGMFRKVEDGLKALRARFARG